MHTGGHYTILRRNELEVHTETLTDLKNRALGEEKKRKNLQYNVNAKHTQNTICCSKVHT